MPDPASHPTEGALPTFVVIGAMKCGTTALHRLLGTHPQIAVSNPKELNFFFGDAQRAQGDWCAGNAHRGLDWYRSHFAPDALASGESSPGYTSPDHPEAAPRMAAVLPRVQLIYLVRDPIERAVSQYRHHRRDGDERRPLAEALLDPNSQYLSRSRYAERLAPFLACFSSARITIVAQEELRAEPSRTLRWLCARLGVAPDYSFPSAQPAPLRPLVELDPALHADLAERLRDDADRLRELAGRQLRGWRI
ncbi:MAG: sulfotransferase family protein [Egibacteraceae bacterium]